MENLQENKNSDMGSLLDVLSARAGVTRDMVSSFGDYAQFLTELLRANKRIGSRLLSAGHVEPEIEIAADRAGIELMENIGPSPFSDSVDAALAAVNCPRDIIYVANPNRVTGANYSLADIQRLAEAIPNGLLAVDEYYFDYFGISAAPLLEENPHVIVIRQFAHGQSGYVLAHRSRIASLSGLVPDASMREGLHEFGEGVAVDAEAFAGRLREVHDESLRIAMQLTRLGAQTRVTATDFILIRVADPAQTGNHLTRAKVQIDNLDGYPAMRHYLRYRIGRPLANDRLIQAFQGMPPEVFRLKALDRRSVTMRLKNHGGTASPAEAAIARMAEQRLLEMAGEETGVTGRR